MACEICGAPTGYVAGHHLSACIESKMEYHKKLKQLRAEVARLTEELEAVKTANRENEDAAGYHAQWSREFKSQVDYANKQLTTAKLEGFNEGIEAVIQMASVKYPARFDFLNSIRALKHESFIKNDELGEVV